MALFYSLGLMSGSSLDGLDICYNLIHEKEENYSYKILDGITVPFPKELYQRLENCRNLNDLDLEDLDSDFGKWMGKVCQHFLLTRGISHLDFIASHGHTVYHFPHLGLTKQIGKAKSFIEYVNYPIIYNLREKDVLDGGQGAPIVPIADLLLFSDVKYCLNLGGIMNISIKEHYSIRASDIGVCNQILNYFAKKLGLDYDKNGNIGRQGVVNHELLNKLNENTFFSLPFPKSLDNSFTKKLILICTASNLSLPDILRTLYEHIVFQIKSYIADDSPILITGGGAHNIFLIELLEKEKLNLLPIDQYLIDYKEALAMSLMGVRFMEKKYNVLASVTGATNNTICGDVFYPGNFLNILNK